MDVQRPPVPGEPRQGHRPRLRLRHHHRRDRQLPDALPDERRVARLGQENPAALHPREHPALRGPRVNVPAVRRPLLPVPLPGAAAAGHGALVRRGRRARRPLRRDGKHHGGNRGHQDPARHRRHAVRPAPDLRRPRHDVHRAEGPPRPGLPGLRPERAARVPRLRRVVRGRPPGDGGGDRMSVVRIPPVLRTATGGEREVQIDGATVADVLDALYERHPAVRSPAADTRGRAAQVRQRLPQRRGRPAHVVARHQGGGRRHRF